MKKILSYRNILLLFGLILIHFGVFSQILDSGSNILLFFANSFFIVSGLIYSEKLQDFKWWKFLSGYLILFCLVFIAANRPLLFILMVLGYSAVYHRKMWASYIFILCFSLIVVSAYWVTAFILGSFAAFSIIALFKKLQNKFELFLSIAGFVFLIILIFPVINLLFQYEPQTLMTQFSPEVRSAIWVSISSSAVSTVIILLFGVPLAYIMARKEFASKPLVDALIDLPIIVPQTAAGIALLVLLGPKTPIGAFLYTYFGISFSGSFSGIVACQVFVSSPFLIRSAIHAFESVNTKLENISRSLGAGPVKTFFKISLPLASAGIFNGCILTFSRAISEAGSLMIVAYRPTTIPVMLNDVFLQYGVREAAPITVVFIIICIWSFIALKWIYEMRRRSILAP